VSLRARLVAATLLLFTIGLVVAGASTYGFLRTFLLDQVDSQLIGVRLPATRALLDAAQQQEPSGGAGDGFPGGPFPGRGGSRTLVPPGTYAELRDAAGRLVTSVSFGFRDSNATTPRFPAHLSTPADDPADASPTAFTVGDQSGSGQRYRASAVALSGGAEAVVALPMHDVDATLRRLVRVELAVAAAVLMAIAMASLLLIRRGLRPLDRIGDTAGAIAAGDLSRRVEGAGGRTEIGRLGTALNAMLGQIEAAFAERRATEARLRRFLADASHELRTPLTSIRGWAELFRRGASSRPEDLARTMRRIEEEAAHMGVLVDDMLSLARLDEGRPLVQEPVDLTALATDAVDDLRAAEPGRPVTLEAAGPVVVAADPTRLKEVFANLLGNARYHTPEGTPVHVRVAAAAEVATIEVGDEGPGMSTEEAARVFERFYRADPARTRAKGGAGLGLAIVAAIADAHGGSAAVTTAPGQGARFRVTLPVTPPVPAAPAAPAAADAPPPAPGDNEDGPAVGENRAQPSESDVERSEPG